MDVEVLEQSATSAKLRVRGVNHAFLNALRRTLIAEVPKLAIDDVTVYDNTSALFDEMLAHRLGLLPVPTDLGLFNFRDACVCGGEGCPSCTVLFTLSKEGPGMVTSGDLSPADPRFAVVDPDIPIVKLLEGQRVMLEAAAVLGHGSTHAKWSTITAMGYREAPKVKVGNGTVPPAAASEMEKLAPENSVRIEDGKIRVLDEERAFDFLTAVSDRYDLGFVTLSEEKDAFVVVVETDGSLSPKAAVQHAVSLLADKLKALETEAPKLAKEA